MKQLIQLVYFMVLVFMVSALGFTITAMAAYSTQQARALVIQVTSQVTHAIDRAPDTARRNPARLYKLLDRTVAPHFDFDSIAGLVLGHYSRTATPQQRQHFTRELRTHLLQFYSSSLAKYQDQKIVYEPVPPANAAGEVVVKTEVQQKSETPIPINYRLHLVQGRWKVIDVTIDGVSMVISNRSSFAAILREGGIDELTAQLAAHNRSNGT